MSTGDRFLVRDLAPTDIDACIALDRRVADVPWPESAFRRAASGGHLSRVAVSLDQVIGFCIGRLIVDEYSVLNLMVDPAFRRRGIALNLVLSALGRSVGAGAENAFLEVRESNQSALNLYDQLGFHTIGVREGYYPAPKRPERTEAAILMARSLTDADEIITGDA